MTDKQEISDELRDKLSRFFSFSYTHFTIQDLLTETINNELFDPDNQADRIVIDKLKIARLYLEASMQEAFGKHRMELISKANGLIVDNDAKGESA